MVLRVNCGSVSVLLTADAEAESEREMLAVGVLGDVDVLKVGHHGSRTSTSPEFLAAVRPEVGVISAGLGNSYGHPHPDCSTRPTFNW
jgi:competence protein ComEC